jgi:hypothetical protein
MAVLLKHSPSPSARRFASIVLASVALVNCGNDLGSDPLVSSGGSTAAATVATMGAGGSGGAGSVTTTGSGGSDEADAEPDAGVDASIDGGADTHVSLEEDILAIFGAKSSECLACATAGCPNLITRCGTLTGTASKGPSAGKSKAELCVEALACVVPAGCGMGGAVCYCGVARPDPLFHCPKDETPCAATIERTLETSDPVEVINALSDESKAGAWAFDVMQCLRDHQCASCLEGPIPEGGVGDALDEEAASDPAN